MRRWFRRRGIDRRFMIGAVLALLVIPVMVFIVMLNGQGGGSSDTATGITIGIFTGLLLVTLVCAVIGLPVAILAWSVIFSFGRSLGLSPRQTAILPAICACSAATAPLLYEIPVIVWLAVAGFLSLIATVFTVFAYHGAQWQELA